MKTVPIKVSEDLQEKIDKRKEDEKYPSRGSVVRDMYTESELYRGMKKKESFFICGKCTHMDKGGKCSKFKCDVLTLYNNGIIFDFCRAFENKY